MIDTHARPVLVDVSSVVVRGYYADEALARRDGRPHRPLHQLVSMIESLTRTFERAPGSAAAAVLDVPGPTWRHTPTKGGSWDYKAKRRPKPDLLRDLLRDTPALWRAMGFPTILRSGYEADDVLASLAHRTSGAILVTPDKDLHQCLGACAPGGHGAQIWDPLAQQEGSLYRGAWVTRDRAWDKWQIDIDTQSPRLVVEMQALLGDPVDGIPGARGIGPKAAQLLVREYGSAEAALRAAAAGPLPEWFPRRNAVRRTLVDHADDVRLSHRLASLVTDLDVQPGVMCERDEAAIGALLDRWERMEVPDVAA